MDDPHQLTVRIQTLNGGWETLGADRYRGVVPEGLTCSANRWGSDVCSFSLRRDTSVLSADISTWTPVEISVAGAVVWDGRIRATPTSESSGSVVSVQGQGWQYHLDDDSYSKVYAQTRLTEYQDARSFLTADLATMKAYGQITVGDGVILMMIPNGTVVPVSTGFAVTIDLGPGNGAKRGVVTADSSNNVASTGLYMIGTDVSWWNDGSRQDFFSGIANNAGATLTQSNTTSNVHRYITFLMFSSSFTAAADVWFRIKTVQLFSDTAYESGGASILKIDQIANDALSQATTLLSTDRSEIKTGTFSIPEFAVTDQTPRQVIASANAYENFETKMLIGRRLAVRPRPTVPIYEIGAWSGAAFEDASAGSGDDIINRFLVRGTGPDGGQLLVDRRSSGIGVTTLADRRGFLHTRVTTANAAITTAVGNRIGDLYLKAYSTAPFSGGFQATMGGVRRADTGQEVHPAWMLLGTGQLVRCVDRVDPDTGAWGRAGEIDSVTYTADDLSSSVTINENRAGLDSLLARYQVVVSQLAS